MDVVQTYSVLDPEAAWMVTGAPQGWAQTLVKLAAEVTRMHHGGAERSVVHATFQLLNALPPR
jgi:uncharacterized lipoprotein YmbA